MLTNTLQSMENYKILWKKYGLNKLVFFKTTTTTIDKNSNRSQLNQCSNTTRSFLDSLKLIGQIINRYTHCD